MQIIQGVHQMSAEDSEVRVQVTPYVVNMGLSLNEFGKDVNERNLDFKENVLRKVQTIKLRDTSELNKKVEELKIQEANELQTLNKTYMELDQKVKKMERKVSFEKP